MVTNNIIERVFRILHNDQTGSCYTIEKGENQYLVSAAHIFRGVSEIPYVEIYHEKRWKEIEVQTVLNVQDKGDTIVFKLAFDISPRTKISLGLDGMILGTWAYFLGFPFDMSTPADKLSRNYPIPLIKAGLISSMDYQREGLKTIFLDGHNNKGFSGGPVVWGPPGNNSLQIIGTVSGYLLESTTHTETLEEIKAYGTNAGIVEAFWIDDILERI